MSELKGVPGEMRATIHITRKATGKVETFEIIGHTDAEQHAEIMAQARRNKVHGAVGSMVGQGSTLSNTPKNTELVGNIRDQYGNIITPVYQECAAKE